MRQGLGQTKIHDKLWAQNYNLILLCGLKYISWFSTCKNLKFRSGYNKYATHESFSFLVGGNVRCIILPFITTVFN
jgi:hypothetical protein